MNEHESWSRESESYTNLELRSKKTKNHDLATLRNNQELAMNHDLIEKLRKTLENWEDKTRDIQCTLINCESSHETKQDLE